MLYTYSISGEGEPCRDWATTAKSHSARIVLTCQSSESKFKLIQFTETEPRLLEGYFSGECTDTSVGIREVDAKQLNVSLQGTVLARECSTCVSVLVETDIFEIPDGAAIYWCEVLETSQGVFEGNCWEYSTSYVSGHLQPRIRFGLDIFKDTRTCPFEHSLATKICEDEKKYLRNYLEKFTDPDCTKIKRYSQVVVSLYVMSCYYAHDYEITGMIERMEEIFRNFESTSVSAFWDMLSSGAQSNAAPSLVFLKIARDLMSEQDLARCETLAGKFWGWKRLEYKKQRKKITKEDIEDIDIEVGDSAYTPTKFKTELVQALFTEEYFAILERRDFCSDRVLAVCNKATEKLLDLAKLPEDSNAGRSTPFLEYDMVTARASTMFKALDSEQMRTRSKSAGLKSERATTHIPYTKIFFLNSPCVMQLPGNVLNGMHNPMTRFLEFHAGKKKKKK